MLANREDARPRLAARLDAPPLTRPRGLAIPRGGGVGAALVRTFGAELDVVLAIRRLHSGGSLVELFGS